MFKSEGRETGSLPIEVSNTSLSDKRTGSLIDLNPVSAARTITVAIVIQTMLKIKAKPSFSFIDILIIY